MVVDKAFISLIKGVRTLSRPCFSMTGTVATIARLIILSCDRYWGEITQFLVCVVSHDFPGDYIFQVHHNKQLSVVQKNLEQRADD